MAHLAQMMFIAGVKARFPKAFKNVDVLEVGSYNVNGTVRVYFTECNYIGIDLAPGKDVDVVCAGHEYQSVFQFDTTISTECFEHDPHWRDTFSNMHHLTKEGGLVIFTCAAANRHEHGTNRTTPQDSALASDYYKNLNIIDFEERFSLRELFVDYVFEANRDDLFFYGVKR